MSDSTLWLPGRVRHRHKKAAYCVWGSLVALLIGYSIWVVYEAVEKRKNPSVSITVERQLYDFPDVSVCFYEGEGCDTDDTTGCADSPILGDLAREAFISEANGFIVDGGNATDTQIKATPSQSFANCLEFTLSELTVNMALDDSEVEPLVTLRLRWVTGVGVTSDEEPSLYRKLVYIYLTDGGGALLDETPGIPIPYNRFGGQDLTEAVATSMNIALTETRSLGGAKTRSYSASSLVHFDYEYPGNGWNLKNADDMEALLLLEIRQPTLSYTILEEQNPVQLAAIIGSIGGAWELLLILWGLMFIADTRSSPDLKARNFRKTARNVFSGSRTNSANISAADSAAEHVPASQTEEKGEASAAPLEREQGANKPAYAEI